MSDYDDIFIDELRAALARPPRAQDKSEKGVCRFNRNIDCSAVGNRCGKCGWNPAVAEIRSQEIRRRLGIGNKTES